MKETKQIEKLLEEIAKESKDLLLGSDGLSSESVSAIMVINTKLAEIDTMVKSIVQENVLLIDSVDELQQEVGDLSQEIDHMALELGAIQYDKDFAERQVLLIEECCMLFSSVSKMYSWLVNENSFLDNRTPISMCDTEENFERIIKFVRPRQKTEGDV